ncbi:hypothetical protein A5662_07010 [Mycobacteriaceae bacterium 1482268.1]|nr:hypothetical protein A5662_07010 [Mycobacteriaceae bacterium 1482268.1]
MSEQNQAVIRADSMQAAYFRAFLADERADLQRYLGEHVTRLQGCMTVGSTRLVSHHRRCIRTTENQIRHVDSMLARLDRRFPRARH